MAWGTWIKLGAENWAVKTKCGSVHLVLLSVNHPLLSPNSVCVFFFETGFDASPIGKLGTPWCIDPVSGFQNQRVLSNSIVVHPAKFPGGSTNTS